MYEDFGKILRFWKKKDFGKRKYQVGGSGIFSKLKDFLSGFISKKQVVGTALNIAQSAGLN